MATAAFDGSARPTAIGTAITTSIALWSTAQTITFTSSARPARATYGRQYQLASDRQRLWVDLLTAIDAITGAGTASTSLSGTKLVLSTGTTQRL